ncbi:phospholipase D-like domain-containing protein [Coraliomargarita akajimensis]|uniref:Phospholipase D/Transphosphatidylase n=1 Tax=Coraliomargarita akajimensis (strain DSM 45221 / IAM 15411 / JCM 23193 / KCTC 12865 / 04OKA010-24) TaxID=583355 RepID=D5EJS7_CORAD|nr:phospholipase D-like domain-containing protein [Coraliomargarita akajimensis]ADE54676.1 phospholipase D/Transphosphatidylase [Coraliomargarita akajimensis DSM 45221]
MWSWFRDNILLPLNEWALHILSLVFTNIVAIAGFVLALLIIRRVLMEKRSPSNFFAWFFIVVLAPPIGVPLYFMFGGRKSRRVTRIKQAVFDEAQSIAEHLDNGPHDMLEHADASATTTGNHTELLPDGVSGFERFCQEIREAKHSIHIATYILGDDATGRSIVDLLVQRAEEGVTVRLLLDSLGSWNCTRRARHRLRKAGGQVAMFIPVLPFKSSVSTNLRNHRKIAVFDNCRAITGGQNLDNRFMGPSPDDSRFTDFSVVTHGPAVAHLHRIFISDWAFASKEPASNFRTELSYHPEPAGDSTIEVMASGPDVSNDPLWEQILRIIQEFRQSFTIITPYFIPDEVLFRSMIVKAHTGRQIRLVLPLKSNQRLVDIARYHFLRQLNEAGVEILFYKPRMIHAKLILADNKVALTGSANMDMRSLFVNFEIGQLHYSPRDLDKLQTWAEDIYKDCISYDEAIAQGIMPNRSIENVVHLVTPLL